MKVSLYAEVVDGYRDDSKWQSGELWVLDNVKWAAIPREGDSLQIGDLGEEDDHEGISERVSRVFWVDDGSVCVECGKVFTCDMPLAEYEAALSRRGWVRYV